MARSVTYNGTTLFRPGGIVKVHADALNQVLPGANSVMLLIGEAEGGAPGSEGLVVFADPSQAIPTFKEGPLVDAIRTAFQASNDPLIPGGASAVYAYKTNASTQSTASLPGANATQNLSSTSTGGTTTTLIDTTLSGTVDDQFNGKIVVIRPFTSTCEVRTVTDYVASTETFTFATVSSAPTTSPYRVFDPEVEAMDALDVGSSSSTVLAFKDLTVVDDQYNGNWVYIQDTNTVSYLRKIVDTDGTGETVTVSPALPAAPTDGAYVMILPNVIELTSKDYGLHTNGLSVDIAAGAAPNSRVVTVNYEGEEEISGELGGKLQMSILYRGGSAAISDTVAASATTTSIPLVTGSLTPSAHIGQQVKIGDEYTTITANGAATLTVSPALSEAPAATTVVQIRSVTAGTFVVEGTSGAATGLTTTITGVTGDNLDLTFPAGQTLRQLAAVINANPNYLATVMPGINPDTTLSADLDFGADATGSVLVSSDIATSGLTRNVMAIVDYFNNLSSYVSAERADVATLNAGSNVPQTTASSIQLSGGARGVSTNSTFQAGFDKGLTVRANGVVPLIDQDMVNEGYGSTATWASVSAQLLDHVIAARGVAQNVAGERGGYLGFRGTRDEYVAACNSINDMDVAICSQFPNLLSASGNLVSMGPMFMAVCAASMRAGAGEVGEPLTHKLIRTSGVTQDSSWDPADTTDANLLIQNGALFAETIDGRGTRWVRDLTTWVSDDNLAFAEGSVRDAIRYVAYGLRTELVNRFTGRKAKPATIANVKEVASTYLEVLRSEGVIVDSTDPLTGAFLKAYHNLKVYSDGDVLRVNVGICPILGINFILTDIFLALPSQSA